MRVCGSSSLYIDRIQSYFAASGFGLLKCYAHNNNNSFRLLYIPKKKIIDMDGSELWIKEYGKKKVYPNIVCYIFYLPA